jgi:hypothetical protein
MGGLFSKGGKGGKGDFDIVIGQPDYNSFQKVTDAAMVKDYLQSNQPQSQHGPSENAGPAAAAASKAESLPPPPAPREGQGEKAASKKTSSTGDDEEDSDLTEDHSEEASNVEPAAVRQGGDDVSAPSEETEDS